MFAPEYSMIPRLFQDHSKEKEVNPVFSGQPLLGNCNYKNLLAYYFLMSFTLVLIPC